MFTSKAQRIIDLAKDYAFSAGASEMKLSAVLTAIGVQAEAGVLLAECLSMTPDELRAACPEQAEPASCPGKLPLAEEVRTMLARAKEFCDEAPDRLQPGLIDLRHLVCAIANSREACTVLRAKSMARDDAIAQLDAWYDSAVQVPNLGELTDRLRGLRADLLTKVYGQDHAVHAFVEGLFNAEVVAAADVDRKAPRSLFVFAGPPGVGKTYLATLGAVALDRPFKRFDMSAYSGHQQNESLVGMGKSYKGAHPGNLTEFVEKNPNAVLLFDEIEKAHTNTIHLFLQILDAGTLEDKYHERDVLFRDTTIIFTTNAGRQLYDKPNESGVNAANASFHRRTILDALENEKDPKTREPFFPAAICSRMATGYPVLFNHLRINELVRVVDAEFGRVGGLLERQYYKRVTFDDLLPMCMVLREGARVDARTLRSQAESFAKIELFKFCQLFKTDRLEDVFNESDRVHFALEETPDDMIAEVRDLFAAKDKPRILLVADRDLTDLYSEYLLDVEWRVAQTADDALEILAEEEVDLVLLDLWIGRSASMSSMSMRHFDHVPAAARGLDKGQELLRKIRDRLPSMPVFLLSLADSGDEGSIDDELFMACVRGGGARGMVVSQFVDGMVKGWEGHRDRLGESLLATCRRLHRESAAAKMGQERKVLTFDSVPQVDREKREITIRIRNLRLTRAVAAADAGEVLEDVERPRTKFEEVIGADAAKDELKFFIDFLKNPRRFAALGLTPPKGILLHGPPGTGKTMLARAMAAESDVAFISASAANFVTIWQGSGPQAVRDLFARARRYAPAIIFIDEIDAIGRERTGGAGGGQSTENTLNALLTEMDGFTSPSLDRPVFVLAATNFNVDSDDQGGPGQQKRKLDTALVRRFSRTILVDLPEREAREKYLGMRLENRPACSVAADIIKLIAERSSGMSIANLEAIIETAARSAAKSGGELTGALLEEAFESVKYGEARARDPEEVRKTACHEAGHTILYWLSGWWPSYVTIVSRGNHGGYMAPSAMQAEKGGFTKDEFLARIRVSLGGRAAEMAHYSAGAALSTGASGDLEHATNIVRQMLCVYGMYEEFGITAMPELLKYEGAMSSPMWTKLNDTAGQILQEQMILTQKLLAEHREHFDAVTEALVEKERLTAEDLKALLPEITFDG
jgi:cell division protease FtsH